MQLTEVVVDNPHSRLSPRGRINDPEMEKRPASDDCQLSYRDAGGGASSGSPRWPTTLFVAGAPPPNWAAPRHSNGVPIGPARVTHSENR